MSNIERRYAKLDEGVFPEEGEYGVTYLTLYSSNAGNVYDGWVYDPDNKVEESLDPRTYGYRNPDYPQYCWDDELVVDLSNAQSRQESSEFIQGRITSFNTNVSDRPIVLQDIDITGLTEEERENRATTVLFCAIPLVQDAYIQAQVEVQCKCNLSPDNTSGEMRIEAFYILNDESDRTMRPNPVHTFTVSSPNERHTLPWLYWNPALRHEDHNYIGVKLICTGGTAEIGISDNPDYGDAMITLGSAGMTGDKIDSGKPVYLEIFGKEEVVGGYELDINDYTVICTYDTGEVYNVTNMCTFTPAMGTAIIDATTILTANYMGLHASMVIYLGLVESIELIGPEEFYDEQLIDENNYVVLAYLDNGDIMEVTSECTFDPIIGTTITETTTVTATFEPFWMSGQTFTASLEVEKVGTEIARVTSGGLTYTLYQREPDTPSYIKITGNTIHEQITTSHVQKWYDYIQIPSGIVSAMSRNSIVYYDLEWAASGPISGVLLPYLYSPSSRQKAGFTSNMINFDNVKIVPYYDKVTTIAHSVNNIVLRFEGNETLTSDKLSFLKNIDCSDVRPGVRTYISRNPGNIYTTDTDSIFKGCKQLANLDFLINLDVSRIQSFEHWFDGCEYLENISGIKDWDMTSATDLGYMFNNCKKLENASDLYKWYCPNVATVAAMFNGSGLTTLSGLGNMRFGETNSYSGRVNFAGMFSECRKLKRLNGSQNMINSHATTLYGMFQACVELEDISAAANWITSNVTTMAMMFNGCVKLKDISAVRDWDTSEVTTMENLFGGCPVENDGYVNGWNIDRCENFTKMFSCQNPSLEEIGWSGSSLVWSDSSRRILDDYTLVIMRAYNTIPSEERIGVIQLRGDRWREGTGSNARYPYYYVSRGMYTGRDIFRATFEIVGGERRLTSFSTLYDLPSWYRTILQNKLVNNKDTLEGYNYDW